MVATEEREKRKGGGTEKKEKTDDYSGHYVKQSTARTPTAGTPHARANYVIATQKDLLKGVISSYQIRVGLPSVA